MVVTVTNFISFDRANVRQDLMEEMRVLARITAARSAAAVAFGDQANAHENLSALALRSTIQHACIYDENHQRFANFQRQGSLYDNCPDELGITKGEVPESNGLLIAMEPISRRGKQLGYVLVASDLSPIAERTRRWVVTSAFVTLAALLVAFIMTRRLQMGVVRPILHLANVMDQVKQKNDLSLRAQGYGNDEVGRLVDSFNDMLNIVERHNQDLETLYQDLVDKSAEAEATAASMEASNQRVKDLFGSAAHDLRQPLQAITIFADALHKKISDPEQADILDKLKQALANLSSLFTEILDVSRYDFDLKAVGSRPTAIKSLLSKVYLEFEAMAEEKGLKLRFHTADYKVIAYGALLERIIRNLLSNAIRYTDKGGVLIGCRRRGDNLAIEVWDTGRGIPEQKQKQMFSKFVQVSDEDRENGGGFGLGLAIVKQFVDTLGYELTVHSRVGRGTVFRLIVPLAPDVRQPTGVARQLTEAAPDELPNLSLQELSDDSETRVLLVDDNDDVRNALKLTLIGWGFTVDDFSSVEAMREHYRHGGAKPSLIISDYELGDSLTGDFAIAAAREALGQEVPAFIVSGAEQEEVWQTIHDSGFAALRKPVKPARLRAMINHVMR